MTAAAAPPSCSVLKPSLHFGRVMAEAFSARSILFLCILAFASASAQATTLPTTTALTISSNTVNAGTATVLTATVAPASRGEVVFCVATAVHCTGLNRLQTVQVTVAGTATFRKIFGAGSYSIKAVFQGTSSAQGSTSSPQSLTVTGAGIYATASSISATGNPGDYSLIGTVAGFGFAPPTGSIDFLNTTAGNVPVTSAPIGASVVGFANTPSSSTTTNYAILTGDFNNDGIPDLVSGFGDVVVQLGLGNGTFSAGTNYPAGNGNHTFAAADLNGDGNLDLVITDFVNGTQGTTEFNVLFGNGDGSFQTPVHYSLGVGSAVHLALADVDRDGIMDTVLIGGYNGVSTIYVMRGTASGIFQAPTTYASPVGNVLALGDFNNDGIDDIAVGGYYNAAAILLGNTDGTFQPYVTYGMGSSYYGSAPTNMVVGDFNNDGNLDLAFAEFGDGNLGVLIGQGDGTFPNYASYIAPGANPLYYLPYGVAAGDFNGDGVQDLVLTTLYQGSVVYLGVGDGTFQLSSTAGSPTGTFGAAVADFNGDGLDDYAAADIMLSQRTVTATASHVSVPGPGSQQIAASYPGDLPHAVSTSTTISLLPLQSVTVLSSTPASASLGTAVMLTATVSPVPTGSGSAGAISFYNGGVLLGSSSVVGSTATYTTGALPAGYNQVSATYTGNSVLGGSSSGTLAVFVGPQTATSLDLSTNSLTAGAPLVLTATTTSGGTGVFPGQITFNYLRTVGGATSSGTFGTVQLTSTGTAVLTTRPPAGSYGITANFLGTMITGPSVTASRTVAVASSAAAVPQVTLDAAGSVGNYMLTATVMGFGSIAPLGTVSFLNNTGGGSSVATAVIDPQSASNNFLLASGSPLSNPNALTGTFADVNHDGIPDSINAFCGNGTGGVRVRLGVGDGTFAQPVDYPVSTCVEFAAVGDVNGDGNPDIAATSPFDGTVSILLGGGDGTFTVISPALQTGSNFPNSQPFSVHLADLAHSGKLDLVVGNSSDGSISVFRGNGDGTFQAEQRYSVGNQPLDFSLADFNGDGKLDVVVTNVGDSTIGILLGVGDGTFQAQTTFTFLYGDAGGSIATGSLRNNGVADVVLPDLYNPSLVIYRGNNDGTFAAPSSINTNGYATSAILADINHDGKLDLVAAYFGSVGVFYGVGDGTFGPEQDYSTGESNNGGQSSISVAAVDLNGDGLLDLVETNNFVYTSAVLLGVETVVATANAVYVTGSGTQQIVASFPGDANHVTAVSNAVPLLPSVQASSITLLSSSAALIHVGGPVTLTASVMPLPSGPLLGTVSFFNDGNLLSTLAVDSSGQAVFTTSALLGGVHALTATFSGNAALASSFSVPLTETVVIPINATTVIASTVLTVGQGTTAFSPVTASGGNGTLTYSVLPALPAGLSFSPSTGVLSGSVTAVSGSLSYTVTVSDTHSSSSTATFSLTVNSAVNASVLVPSTTLTQGRSGVSFAPVGASGGTGALTYSVSPALPSGLLFAASTGAVSGTPGTTSAAAVYTVTVTDANGAAGTATFSLTVNSAVNASVLVPSTALTQGRSGVSFAPVGASGGTGALTYSVSPALPSGLLFAASTGAVSGTPATTSAAAVYTVTVTDANGAAGTATFSLAINSIIATATAITSSSLFPSFGTSIVLTATVAPAPADTPAGSVRFYSGSTLLATSTLSTAGVATLNTSLPMGLNSLTAVYSGSYRYEASTSSALSISDRAATSLTMSANPTTQLYNNPIVLTAQATSSSPGTLTGMISFLDGQTVVASVPVGPNGQASYTSLTLVDGRHSLTTAYSGDGNFLSSSSTGTAVAVTVADINLNLGGDQNKAVVPGAVVAYSFPLSPLVTPTFLYDVHLTATGLPPGATYTFSPAVIPAGNGNTPVSLNVQTARSMGNLTSPHDKQRSLPKLPLFAFGLLVPLLGAMRVRNRLPLLPRPLITLVMAAIALGVMAGVSGCGAGGFFGATSTTGHYTITVTAVSGNLSRTSTVQLTIQ